MPQPTPLTAAKPARPTFDSWNSSSTGHQRADNRLAASPSWRASRTRKLAAQLADPAGTGGTRLADTVGAGSEAFGRDGRLPDGAWTPGAAGLRSPGQRSIVEAFAVRKPDADEKRGAESKPERPAAALRVFAQLTFYVNGSTYPVISDQRLKQLIVRHGGQVALALGRRTVTHVVVGRANAGAGRGVGAGGGLAAGKMQKELAAARRGVKYVRAEWVVECVRRGRRVSEVGYGGLEEWTRGMGSVLGAVEVTEGTGG